MNEANIGENKTQEVGKDLRIWMTLFESLGPLELMKPQQLWNSTLNIQSHHLIINYQEKDLKKKCRNIEC